MPNHHFMLFQKSRVAYAVQSAKYIDDPLNISIFKELDILEKGVPYREYFQTGRDFYKRFTREGLRNYPQQRKNRQADWK